MNLPNLLVEKSYDEILSECLEIVKKLLPSYAPSEGDNVMLVLRAFAYRELYLREFFNDLASGFFLLTATNNDLDNLAETLYGLYRLSGSKPYADVEFSLASVLSVDLLIPAGFELTDETSTFTSKLLEDVVIKKGELKKIGVVELQTQMASSDVKTEIQISPLPYVQVKQLNSFSNGSNPESDDEFKARIRVSLADKSTAGSAFAYKSYALKADKRIQDVNVLSPSAGVVDVVYYSTKADDVMQERIETALDAEDVRPLTDKVQVKKANEIHFSIKAHLIMNMALAYIDAINNAKQRFSSLKIGQSVTVAQMIDALMVDGVVDVELKSGACEIDSYSIAVLDDVDISYEVAK